MQKILLVEDEPNMVLGLRDNLEYEGYEVIVATNGKDGLRLALSAKADMILLDIMLPEMNGMDVCRRVREQGVETPVIMVSARGQEMDKVMGLEIGADDYLTKPFGISELLARVRALLRRSSKQVASLNIYKFGEIEINFQKHLLTKRDMPVEVTPREFELLKFFIQHKGEILTREQLLDNIWGYDNYPFTRTVDSHIAKLRQKIEGEPGNPRHIITVHRLGYKFID